jgi:hypothetical protein
LDEAGVGPERIRRLFQHGRASLRARFRVVLNLEREFVSEKCGYLGVRLV